MATKKMAILPVSPAVLRALLQLPPGADVVRMEMAPAMNGTVNIVIEGDGWDVHEGHYIPAASGNVIVDGVVDWNLPKSEPVPAWDGNWDNISRSLQAIQSNTSTPEEFARLHLCTFKPQVDIGLRADMAALEKGGLPPSRTASQVRIDETKRKILSHALPTGIVEATPEQKRDQAILKLARSIAKVERAWQVTTDPKGEHSKMVDTLTFTGESLLEFAAKLNQGEPYALGSDHLHVPV